MILICRRPLRISKVERVHHPEDVIHHCSSRLERTVLQQTLSLKPNAENVNLPQQVNKVKLRDHSSKKKKGLRDLKSRISLPPEIKNSSPQHAAMAAEHSVTDGQPLPLKALERTPQYQNNSFSSYALDRSLNHSNGSLTRLSPQINLNSSGYVSRKEQRLSMLDLGYGKIESYTKLEKLGEGKDRTASSIALVFFTLFQVPTPPCTKARPIFSVVTLP